MKGWHPRLLVDWTAGAASVGAVFLTAHHFRLPAFRFPILYDYSTIILVILGAILSSAIVFIAMRRGDVSPQSQAHFQVLAEAIPQIVWIADANGQTTYINKHWYEMTGTPMSESVGTGWIETVHPDDRAPCHEKFQACLRSGETFEIEYRLHDAVKGYR